METTIVDEVHTGKELSVQVGDFIVLKPIEVKDVTSLGLPIVQLNPLTLGYCMPTYLIEKVIPRDIRVGDIVRLAGSIYHNKVLAVVGDKAWCARGKNEGSIYDLGNLVRVP